MSQVPHQVTLLAGFEESAPTEEVPVVPTGGVRRARVPARRLVAVVVGGLIILLLATLLMELALGRVWYESRQRHLVADFTARRLTAHVGQAVAVVQVPRINMNLVVVEGDGPAELRAGPGHRPGTPLPGKLGNSLIFGHRADWGGPFSGMAKMKVGDNVVVEGRDRQAVEFQVVSVKRVHEGDVRPLAASNDYRVTLVTGAGGRFSTDRLVVSAVSGTLGEVARPGKHLRSTGSGDSIIFHPATAIVILCLLATYVTIRVLRRGHRRWVVAVVVAPLVVAGLLALLLQLDLLLPRLA
jgi:LPXTG-site transpeptidase (sortase) family protein